MFAHSLGLESMVRRGRVTDIHDVEQFIQATLLNAVLPSDGVALLNAHCAVEAESPETLCDIDQRLLLMKAAPELRLASQQHGRRLLTETSTFTEHAVLADYR